MGYGKEHPLHRALLCFLVIGLSVLSVITLSDAASFPGDSKVAQSVVIESISKGEAQELIVVLDETAAVKKAATLRSAAGVSHDTSDIVSVKAGMYRSMKMDTLSTLTAQEVEPLKDYKRLPIMFVKVKSLAGLQKLAAQPGVKGIYPNRKMKTFLAESLPLINQPAAVAAGQIGTGTSVAVIDTGVNYAHADFGTCGVPGDCLSLPAPAAGCRVACVHDFVGDAVLPDDLGHGTNVSAIVAGVAPGTNILGLDVFGLGGTADDANILAAIDWVIENKSVYNITAINMSLGVPGFGLSTPCPTDSFALPVAEARAAGILTTIASGNDGFTTGSSTPACVPAAVSVGAVYDADLGGLDWGDCVDDTTAADQITCFSNNSYYTTLLAPGAMITAGGFTYGGTSMAAPHVAGAVAILKGDNAFPGESADITVNRMVRTGKPITDSRTTSPIVKPRIDLNGAITGQGLMTIHGKVKTVQVSTTLRNWGGTPVEGATITVSGPISTTATTDEDGNFSITGLPAGTYTVTASKITFSFLQPSRTVTLSNNNVGLEFIVKTYSIAGFIKPLFKGDSVSGINVTVTGCDIGWIVSTDAKGRFAVNDLPNCSYLVVPDKTTVSGHAFTPDSRAVTLSGKNIKKVSFTTP